jgi:hypothetical protein
LSKEAKTAKEFSKVVKEYSRYIPDIINPIFYMPTKLQELANKVRDDDDGSFCFSLN